FFHAEDGIRDRNVTGVQTCALPISFCTSQLCCETRQEIILCLFWSKDGYWRKYAKCICGKEDYFFCCWCSRNWANNVVNMINWRSEEHTSELQSRFDLVCRLLLENT